MNVRPANTADSRFLAWVALAASRSHVETGIWDLWIPGSDEDKLNFLEGLLLSDHRHWCHYTSFVIAEVDGEPGAALSGYTPDDPDFVSPTKAIINASIAAGLTEVAQQEAFERMHCFLACLPQDEPGAWIIEWVATSPSHRRKGLVQALIADELEIGRARGHGTSQIMILSGNNPAQRAYEQSGFRYVDERRSAAFESATGSPGILRMLRPI